MDLNLLQGIWQSHSGKIVGTSLGFLFSVFIILVGFFQTLFVTIFVIIGYVVGKRIDEKEDIMDILDKLLPPGYHR